MEETQQLGGNIDLTGFNELDRGIMVIVKKIVGNYTRKISDKCTNFEKLSLTMKKVHATENGEQYEIHAKVIDNGKTLTSDLTERNLFVAIDTCMKKIMNQMDR